MIIKQISVFIENRPGTLAEVLTVLGGHNINIRALSVADTADFGILRLIVNEPEKVERLLKEASLAVKITPVLTMKISDKPGGLLADVKKLTAAGINIEYVYAFAASAAEEARVVMKVDDLAKAVKVINGENAESEGPGFYW
ncbi:MAG TPA: ACT domain-containing protein [Negativicutes bacterium]|nr:ACT domain-containing protein [Negativicutes bacterium]